MTKNKFDMDGATSIRNAIIERACRDYMKVLVKRHKLNGRPLDIKDQSTYDLIRMWFLSEDFLAMHLTLPGQWFLDKMDNMSYEDLYDSLKKGNGQV